MNKFFQKWDPRAFNRFLAHAFRELPTELYPESAGSGNKRVTLKATKAQELFTFLRPTNKDGKVGLEDGKWLDDIHFIDQSLHSSFAVFLNRDQAFCVCLESSPICQRLHYARKRSS